MDWIAPFLFGLVGLIGLILLSVPIGFALMLTGFLGLVIFSNTQVAITALAFHSLYESPYNFLLVAIPLFVLMAQILYQAGATERLYTAFWNMLAGIRGALATATVGMGAVLGAIMGSSVASVATMAHLGVDEMTKRGYRGWLATGVVAGAGGLAIVIPPSLPAIIYCFVMELPVLYVFAAGMIPGVMMAIGYGAFTLLYPLLRPAVAPTIDQDVTLRTRIRGAVNIVPYLALIVLVLGVIFSGLSSVTEAAAIGVVGALVIALIWGTMKSHRLHTLLTAAREAAITTCFLMLIVVGAVLFGFFWAYTGVISALAEAIVRLPLPPLGVLLCMNGLLLFFGMFMNSTAIILVVLPVMVQGLMGFGYNPIHLGIVFLINLEMGLTTPPVGMNLFVLAGITERYGIPFRDVLVGVVPFLLVDALVLMAVILFPSLALWFPSVVR